MGSACCGESTHDRDARLEQERIDADTAAKEEAARVIEERSRVVEEATRREEQYQRNLITVAENRQEHDRTVAVEHLRSLRQQLDYDRENWILIQRILPEVQPLYHILDENYDTTGPYRLITASPTLKIDVGEGRSLAFNISVCQEKTDGWGCRYISNDADVVMTLSSATMTVSHTVTYNNSSFVRDLNGRSYGICKWEYHNEDCAEQGFCGACAMRECSKHLLTLWRLGAAAKPPDRTDAQRARDAAAAAITAPPDYDKGAVPAYTFDSSAASLSD